MANTQYFFTFIGSPFPLIFYLAFLNQFLPVHFVFYEVAAFFSWPKSFLSIFKFLSLYVRQPRTYSEGGYSEAQIAAPKPGSKSVDGSWLPTYKSG